MKKEKYPDLLYRYVPSNTTDKSIGKILGGTSLMIYFDNNAVLGKKSQDKYYKVIRRFCEKVAGFDQELIVKDGSPVMRLKLGAYREKIQLHIIKTIRHRDWEFIL